MVRKSTKGRLPKRVQEGYLRGKTGNEVRCMVWRGRSRRSNFYPSFNYVWAGDCDRLDVIEDVVVKGVLYTQNYVSDRYRCRLALLRKYVSEVKLGDLAVSQKVASEVEYGTVRGDGLKWRSKLALVHDKVDYLRWHWDPMCGGWQRRGYWLRGELGERKILSCPSIFRFGAVKELYDSGVQLRSWKLESEVVARRIFLSSGKSCKDLPKYSLRFQSKSDGDVKYDNELQLNKVRQGICAVLPLGKKLCKAGVENKWGDGMPERVSTYNQANRREVSHFRRAAREHFLVGGRVKVNRSNVRGRGQMSKFDL